MQHHNGWLLKLSRNKGIDLLFLWNSNHLTIFTTSHYFCQEDLRHLSHLKGVGKNQLNSWKGSEPFQSSYSHSMVCKETVEGCKQKKTLFPSLGRLWIEKPWTKLRRLFASVLSATQAVCFRGNQLRHAVIYQASRDWMSFAQPLSAINAASRLPDTPPTDPWWCRDPRRKYRHKCGKTESLAASLIRCSIRWLGGLLSREFNSPTKHSCGLIWLVA